MKAFITLLITFVTVMPSFAQGLQAIAIGTTLPMAETKMKSVDGKPISIKEISAKNGVLVMFSCNTCPVVKKYQSRTVEVAKQAKQNGFGVIIINSNAGGRSDGDSYLDMQRYAKQQHYNVPYVLDENATAANAFGATRTPECFLFNAKHLLVYHGAIDNNQDIAEATKKYMANALVEVATGRPVTINNTRSVGCSIRRPE